MDRCSIRSRLLNLPSEFLTACIEGGLILEKFDIRYSALQADIEASVISGLLDEDTLQLAGSTASVIAEWAESFISVQASADAISSALFEDLAGLLARIHLDDSSESTPVASTVNQPQRPDRSASRKACRLDEPLSPPPESPCFVFWSPPLSLADERDDRSHAPGKKRRAKLPSRLYAPTGNRRKRQRLENVPRSCHEISSDYRNSDSSTPSLDASLLTAASSIGLASNAAESVRRPTKRRLSDDDAGATSLKRLRSLSESDSTTSDSDSATSSDLEKQICEINDWFATSFQGPEAVSIAPIDTFLPLKIEVFRDWARLGVGKQNGSFNGPDLFVNPGGCTNWQDVWPSLDGEMDVVVPPIHSSSSSLDLYVNYTSKVDATIPFLDHDVSPSVANLASETSSNLLFASEYALDECAFKTSAFAPSCLPGSTAITTSDGMQAFCPRLVTDMYMADQAVDSGFDYSVSGLCPDLEARGEACVEAAAEISVTSPADSFATSAERLSLLDQYNVSMACATSGPSCCPPPELGTRLHELPYEILLPEIKDVCSSMFPLLQHQSFSFSKDGENQFPWIQHLQDESQFFAGWMPRIVPILC